MSPKGSKYEWTWSAAVGEVERRERPGEPAGRLGERLEALAVLGEVEIVASDESWLIDSGSAVRLVQSERLIVTSDLGSWPVDSGSAVRLSQ